jgi:hypothetical protein
LATHRGEVYGDPGIYITTSDYVLEDLDNNRFYKTINVNQTIQESYNIWDAEQNKYIEEKKPERNETVTYLWYGMKYTTD